MIRNIGRRIIDWLGRIGHKRGFGIQSPWAYAFVRDVIAEERPYYSYSDIEGVYNLDRRERKIGRLLLRVANFMTPELLIHNCADEVLLQYLKCGCGSMEILEDTEVADTQIPDNSLFLSDASGFNMSLIGKMKRDCVLVLLGLRGNSLMFEELKRDNRMGITFDLGDVAICFVRNAMHKQHYKMNF